MEMFPPGTWDVRHLEDFEEITVPAPAGSQFHMQALLVGKPSHGREGQFKFLVTGQKDMSFEVNVSEVIDDSLFDDMVVECEVKLGSVVRPITNVFRTLVK